MAWKTQTIRQWYHHWLLWTLVVLAVAVFFGWRKAKGRYERWKAGRQVRHAADFIAQGDYQHAMIEARSALGVNPRDPDATRLMAETSENIGGAAMAAQWRSRLDSIAPGDPQNMLWLIAMENRDVAQLQKLVSIFVKTDAKSAAFRNHFAFFSLLTRTAEGNPQGEAGKLFRENPGEAGITLTRALALYQQGKISAAIALTGGLSEAELMRPQAALYHAIFRPERQRKAPSKFLNMRRGCRR